MTRQMHIEIHDKVYLEIDYKFYPRQSSYDYDVPPDSEEIEISKAKLCTDTCSVDITYLMDDLQPLMSFEAIIQNISNHIHE